MVLVRRRLLLFLPVLPPIFEALKVGDVDERQAGVQDFLVSASRLQERDARINATAERLQVRPGVCGAHVQIPE